MTIRDCIDLVNAIKPNTAEETSMVEWINQIENTIYREIVLTHEYDGELPAEPKHETADEELLVGTPYDQLYMYWLMSQVDLQNQELALYQNSSALFNKAYTDYRNYYNRTHMPIERARIHYTGRGWCKKK